MKRYGNLYQKIYDMDNLTLAHKKAKAGKGWYQEVKMIDSDPEKYLKILQDQLINHTYHTSDYTTFIKKDSQKERLIYKLPYFPDRICQWAILLVIEPILIKHFTSDTYSAIPTRGIHQCLHNVRNAIQKDVPNCQYCLKLDVKKYYPSINHDVLKSQYRKLFKDPDLIWLLDEIIDSTDGDTGVPIGNYLSQYSGNMYLSWFDHWIKEEKHVKHYFRYMDDIVIFSSNKDELHNLKHDIDEYFWNNLRLEVKHNWQIFPTYVRGVDFVGYRIFLNFTILRKSTCKNMKSKLIKLNKKRLKGEPLTLSDWCSVNSYTGWMIHCDSYRLNMKYVEPIRRYVEMYYILNIKKER